MATMNKGSRLVSLEARATERKQTPLWIELNDNRVRVHRFGRRLVVEPERVFRTTYDALEYVEARALDAYEFNGFVALSDIRQLFTWRDYVDRAPVQRWSCDMMSLGTWDAKSTDLFTTVVGVVLQRDGQLECDSDGEIIPPAELFELMWEDLAVTWDENKLLQDHFGEPIKENENAVP